VRWKCYTAFKTITWLWGFLCLLTHRWRVESNRSLIGCWLTTMINGLLLKKTWAQWFLRIFYYAAANRKQTIMKCVCHFGFNKEKICLLWSYLNNKCEISIQIPVGVISGHKNFFIFHYETIYNEVSRVKNYKVKSLWMD
jgi:hypothetical protein